MDSAGNLHGTTSHNGSSVTHGTVFKLTPPPAPGQPWTEQVLWSFSGPNEARPQSPLTFDAEGNLYGTTTTYAGLLGCTAGTNGCDTVFKLLAPANSPTGDWELGWNFEFSGPNGDAAIGNLVVEHGVVYGATLGGGQYGYGTVFQLKQE